MQHAHIAMHLLPYPYFKSIRCHSKTSPQYKGVLALLSAAIMFPRASGGAAQGKLTWAQPRSIRNNTITNLVFFFSHGFGFVTGAENAAPAISLPEIMYRATKRNRPVRIQVAAAWEYPPLPTHPSCILNQVHG